MNQLSLKRKRILIIVVSVILVIGITLAIVLPLTLGKEKKRAIIVMHGLLGGALMDSSTGEVFWDPLTFENDEYYLKDFLSEDMVSSAIKVFGEEQQNIMSVLNATLDGTEKSLVKYLQLDENGNSINPNVKPVDSLGDTRYRYGALNAYRPMYTALQERYGAYCEVVNFNYDWRCDNLKSAERLEKFINDQGYDEVILCAHSMGNNVVSKYLGKSQENRDKVIAYGAYAGPHYGALAALSMLENPYSLQEVVTNLDLSAMGVIGMAIKPLINKFNVFYERDALPAILNMVTIAQLLPTIEMVDTLHYVYGDSFVNVDGTPITTNAELIAFYKSRPWAKKADGTVKPYIENLEAYFDASYAIVDGEKIHATKLVNTLYFAGDNVNTEISVNLVDNKYDSSTFTTRGDGTVALYSAIIGQDENASNVVIVPNSDHFDIGCDFSGVVAEKSFEWFDATFSKKIQKKLADA